MKLQSGAFTFEGKFQSAGVNMGERIVVVQFKLDNGREATLSVNADEALELADKFSRGAIALKGAR